MSNASAEPGRARRYAPILALLVLLPAYLGVRAVIRAVVDARIERRRGELLPQFSLTDLDGRTVSRDSLLGRATVLHFFRSRCINCELERPDRKAFAAELDRAQVNLVSVMTDRVEGYPPEVTAATLARAGYDWPVLMADEAFVDAFHGAGWAHVTPITYFADARGRIVTTLRGQATRDALREALALAMAPDPAPR